MSHASQGQINIHLRLADPVLLRLLAEQMEVSKAYSCHPENPPDITVCDTRDNAPAHGECLVLGRGQVRLGEVMDRLAYLSSGRRGKLAGGAAGLDAGSFVFFPVDQVLRGVDGREVRVTEKERAMLEVIFTAGTDGVSRQDLLTQVWGYVAGTETHTLETHVYRLRQKLAEFGAADMIEVREGRYFFSKNPPQGGS